MHVLRSIDELAQAPGPVALAIGVFDGLHLGHQEVIRAACEHAAQHHGTAVVMTFEPHPVEVLRPAEAPRRLCTTAHQMRLLAQMGITHALVCPFTPEFAALSAADFVQALVQAARPLGCISVGYTWAFGRGRDGGIHALMDMGQRHGFAVYGVPPVKLDGQVVSSTWIRDAVSAGDLPVVRRLLGRQYSLFGTVRQHRQLGRALGFPTANIACKAGVLPPLGVYAAETLIDGTWHPAIANLGVRPTVEKVTAHPLLEVHILDWQGDLYGTNLEVRLLRQMRPEKKFDSIEALRQQIAMDLVEVRNWLAQK